MKLTDYLPTTRRELLLTAGSAALVAAIAASVNGILAWRKGQELPQPPFVPARAATAPVDTDANRALRAFPEDLDGAAKVEKFEIPGAAKVFVHIRQIHRIDRILDGARTAGANLTPEQRKRLRAEIDGVIATQDGVERVLRAMAARGMLTAFAPEGYMNNRSDDDADYREWCRLGTLPEGSNDTDDRPFETREAEAFSQIKAGASRLLGKDLTDREAELFCYGAAYRIVGDGLARPVGNESFAQNLEATILPNLTGDQSMRMDGRENSILEAAVRSATGTYAVTVMGGAHDLLGHRTAQKATWSNADYQDKYQFQNLNAPKSALYDVDENDERVMYNAQYKVSAVRIQDPKDPEKWNWFGNQDNVGLWNRKHPDQKISVIVVTPEGYGRLKD